LNRAYELGEAKLHHASTIRQIKNKLFTDEKTTLYEDQGTKILGEIAVQKNGFQKGFGIGIEALMRAKLLEVSAACVDINDNLSAF